MYEIEPNGAGTTGNDLTLGSPMRAQLSSASDEDNFGFYVGSDDQVVSLSFDAPDYNYTDFALGIYKPSDPSPTSYKQEVYRDTQIYAGLKESGWYYLRVSDAPETYYNSYSDDQYSVTLNSISANNGSTIYEVEDSDSWVMSKGVNFSGQLYSASDLDFYAIDAFGPGYISVTFTPPSSNFTDYKVSILDPEMNVLASNEMYRSEQIGAGISEAGQYWLLVEDKPETYYNSFADGFYTVSLDFDSDLGEAPNSSGSQGNSSSDSNTESDSDSSSPSGSKNASSSSSGSKNDSSDSSDSKNAPAYNEVSGSKNADDLSGTARNDRISADGGDDIIRASAGDDLVSGGAGRDTLKLTSTSTAATLDSSPSGLEDPYTHLLTHADGTISFDGIERLRFSDMNYALDTDSTETGAGMVARLLIASFGSDNLSLYLGTGISLADGGQSKAQLLELIVSSDLVSSITGAGPSDEDFVAAIFGNVVGSEPNAFQTSIYTDIVSSQGRAAFLELAADNQLTADVLENSITVLGLPYTSSL